MPRHPAADSSLVLMDGVSSTEVTDGLMLLDERRGQLYHLNETGAVVMSALLEGGVETAVVTLCSRYATSAEAARRDVTQFVRTLIKYRVVSYR